MTIDYDAGNPPAGFLKDSGTRSENASGKPFMCFGEGLTMRCPGAQCEACRKEEQSRADKPKAHRRSDDPPNEFRTHQRDEPSRSTNNQTFEAEDGFWTLESLLEDLDRTDNLYLTPMMCKSLAALLRAGTRSSTSFEWKQMSENYTPSNYGHHIWPEAVPFTIAYLATDHRWYTLDVPVPVLGNVVAFSASANVPAEELEALEFAAKFFEGYGLSHIQHGHEWTGLGLSEWLGMAKARLSK